VRELRQNGKTDEVIKHMNPMSSGIPDFSVSTPLPGNTTRTTWCEVKDIKKTIFKPIQLHRCLNLNGWYLVVRFDNWNKRERRCYLFPASERAEWAKLEPMTFEETARKIAVFF
jgi:hypothetical protein